MLETNKQVLIFKFGEDLKIFKKVSANNFLAFRVI